MSTTQQVRLECEDEGTDEEAKPKKTTKKKATKKKKKAETPADPEETPEDEPVEEEEEEEKSKSPFVLLPDLNILSALAGAGATGSSRSQMRIVSLYGAVTEDKAEAAIFSMALLHEEGEYETYKNPDDPEEGYILMHRPFDFYISTYGGSASDMFAIYDVMQSIKKDSDICTIGLGKVMSAGVLLLAAGTKGKRKIGANCRVMLHGVIAGSSGSLISIENEMEETKIMQKMYIQAIAENTNMSEAHLRKLIKRNTNVYLSAKEAVELGIADEII